MVSILSLWLPIFIAAVLVFLVSSVIHSVLGYHASDFGPLPDEERVRVALGGVPAGDYVLPHASSKEERSGEGYQARLKEGPVAFLTVFPTGEIGMGASLVLWFLYCVVVGVFAAYVAGTTLAAGTEYLRVFQVTGTVAFAGYGLALVQNSIWMRRAWSTTLKSLFDALVYALLTAGVFGWLWPG